MPESPVQNPLAAELLINATCSVLEMMAQVAVTPGPARSYRPDNLPGPMISCAVKFEGHLNGSIIVSFTESCLIKIVGAMLGMPLERLSPEELETAGELANMICGETRRQLSEYGLKLTAGIPALIAGPLPAPPSNFRTLVVPFDTSAGELVLEMQVERTQAA